MCIAILRKDRKADPEAFYLEMIDDFYGYAVAQNNNKFANFNRSLKIGDYKQEPMFDQILLASSLSFFSDNEISEILLSNRLKAIGLLAVEAPSTNAELEKAIIRLIKYTPIKDCNEFLVQIQQYNPIIEANKAQYPNLPINSKVLLYQLISGFQTDWMPFAEDNYKDLLKAFIKVCNTSQSFYNESMIKEADVNNFAKNAVIYRYSSVWVIARNAVFSDVSEIFDFNPMNYDTEVNLKTLSALPVSIDLSVKQENCIGGFANCTTDDLGTFKVFEPVWISSCGSLSILSDVVGKQGAWMPAFVLKYAYDKGNEQTTSDLANAAIDVAGLFTGIGELRAGVKGFKMAITLSDIVNSSIGLVDNATNGKLSKEFPSFKACADAMDVFTGAIGMSQAIKSGLNKMNCTLESSYEITKDLTNNTPAKIKLYTENYLTAAESAASETIKWSALPADVRAKHKAIVEYITIQAQIAGNQTIVNRAKALLLMTKNSFASLYNKFNSIDLTLNNTGELLTKSNIKIGQIDKSTLKLTQDIELNEAITITDANSVSVDGITTIEVGGTAYSVSNPKLVKTVKGYSCVGDGAYCFVGGTPVLTSAGTLVNIENITDKSIVGAYDHQLKTNVMGRVTRTFSKTTNQLVKLIIGGTLLWTTVDHPLYANGTYTPAKELHAGDSILSYDGKKQAVEFIKLVDTSATVYNIEVSDYNNYFAGKNSLLVHNNCSFLTVKKNVSVASDWTNFQSNLISSKFSVAERLAMYNELSKLSATDLNAWVKNFNDPKVLAEFNRIYSDESKLAKYSTLFSDLTKDKEKLQVFQEIVNNPVMVYEKKSQGLYNSSIDGWLNSKMWDYVRTGKEFEDAIGGMIDTHNALMMGKLETALGLPSGGLAGFNSVDQLQINIGSTYFVADRALIKDLPDGTIGVYILEMKISSLTSLTANQSSFITTYNGGNITFTTRSTNKSVIVKQGSIINVLGAKRINGPVDNYIITNYQ